MERWTEGNGGETGGNESGEEEGELLSEWNFFLKQKKREKESILNWHNIILWLMLKRGNR